MKTHKYLIAVFVLVAVMATSCSEDYLNINPKGTLTEDQLLNPENIDGFVTSAYAHLPNLGYWQGMASEHVAGSMRSDDAYKGGGGLTDQSNWYYQEVFALATPTMGRNEDTWKAIYLALSRTNVAINAVRKIDESEYPKKDERLGEVLFLRGYQYSHLKRRWRWIPYIREDMLLENYKNVSNHPAGMVNDISIWRNIYNDFKAAAELLPDQQEDAGRPTRWAAEAFAAYTMLWMAYEQGPDHQVTNLNTARLDTALTYLNDIINNGPYELAEDYGNNFLPQYDGINPETVWALQFSKDDGTTNGRVNWGVILNAPTWAPHFTCCDFHKPTHDLVNAFKTGTDGLPLFDTYLEEDINGRGAEFFAQNTFDPRISHTVAIPGHPWKYDPDLLFDSTGARTPAQYGYFNSMKEMVHPDWAEYQYKPSYSAPTTDEAQMRYAEVLLMKAEVLIQLNREDEALSLINEVRERAANSTARLHFKDGTPLLDYHVELYQPGVNCVWDKAFALNAMRWEKRLETACEGRRFYDLVRWGIAEDVMNAHFAREVQWWSWFNVALFTAGRDEYLPIPQNQINLSQGVYVQNPGY